MPSSGFSETIDAQHRLSEGVADVLHSDAELAGKAEDLVQKLARTASGSLAGIKTLFNGLPAAT